MKSNGMRLILYQLRLQKGYLRVWLGYMTGAVLIMNEAMAYVRYAKDMGQAIQILEPFMVAVNNPNTVVFVVIGWLLVISSVPYLDAASMHAVYRTDHKRWNRAVCMTIIIQAFLYYAVLLFATVVISIPYGYWGNCWSYPLVSLSSGTMAVDVMFADRQLVNTETLYCVFGHSFFLMFLYAVLIGVFTYAASLAFSRRIACVMGVLFHFLGFEIMKEGMGMIITCSALAHSIAVLQLGDNAMESISQTYLYFCISIWFLIQLCGKFIRWFDLPAIGKEE